jgi:serine/threonine protein kinase
MTTLQPDAADELIGQTLGRFKILQEIGRTSMSTVYKAWFTSLEVYAAVKVLAPHLAAKPTALKSFHEEARRAASLLHSNIIHIYDVGTESGYHYFAMKYVEGQSLREKLGRRERALNVNEAIAIFRQVAAALAYAHSQGIVHLDVNPNNILLDPSGTAYLTDFGIAQVSAEDSRPEVALGTLGYSSPEQVRREKVDERSDIFSLGVVLYQMATGQLPFQSETILGYRWQILHADPRPPNQINQKVPLSLERAILKALSKDPKERYQHLSEIIRDVGRARPTTMVLKGLSQGPRAIISNVSPRLRALSLPRRDVLAIMGGAGIGLLILVYVVYLALPRPMVVPPLMPPSSPTPRLTIFAGPTNNPSPSPTSTPIPPIATPTPSGRIAFISNRDGNNEIYAMNSDGSEVTRLTNNQADDTSPSWSPDGRRINFVSNRDDSYEIYVMNDDGSGITRLTTNQYGDWGPSWSPDDGRIAFVSDREGNDEIYVMNTDGSEQRNLTNNPAEDWWPCWSPDGRWIAFVSDRDGASEIYVMNADGGGQTRLTSDSDYDLAWSPDGSRIAFVSDRDGNWEVYVMNADGGSQRNLTSNSAKDWWPWWSPDGGRVVFVSDRDGNDEIYVMNTDGTEVINLTNNPARDLSPSWSPG